MFSKYQVVVDSKNYLDIPSVDTHISDRACWSRESNRLSHSSNVAVNFDFKFHVVVVVLSISTVIVVVIVVDCCCCCCCCCCREHITRPPPRPNRQKEVCGSLSFLLLLEVEEFHAHSLPHRQYHTISLLFHYSFPKKNWGARSLSLTHTSALLLLLLLLISIFFFLRTVGEQAGMYL